MIVIMLSIIQINTVLKNVVMTNVILLSAITFNGITLNVITLNVIFMNVFQPSVVVPNVVAPSTAMFAYSAVYWHTWISPIICKFFSYADSTCTSPFLLMVPQHLVHTTFPSFDIFPNRLKV